MRIAYLSASRMPSKDANSFQVMSNCAYMAELGHQVTLYGCLLSPSKLSLNTYGSDLEKIHNLVLLKRPKLRGVGGLIYGLKVAIHVWRSQAPDLIYARDLYSLFFCFMRAKKFAIELHTPPSSFLKKCFYKMILRSSRLAGVVCVSGVLKDWMIKHYAAPKTNKYFVSSNGAQEPLSEACESSSAEFSVAYVGSLSPRKGWFLIEELSRLCPDIPFHIVGDVSDQYAHLKESLPQRDNLIFHGFQAQSQLPPFFKKYSVYIAPYQHLDEADSLSDDTYWGSPLKIFEYMSYGATIVASRIPIIEEVLKDQEEALLLDAQDANAWKDALNALRKSPELRKTLSLNSQDRFQKMYSRKNRVKNILQWIESLSS